MITQTRDEFFSTHSVEPCRYCLRHETPGFGIGPVVAQILFECYARAETERLARKAKNNGISDNRDNLLMRESHALFIRACWLSNQDPANLSEQVPDEAASHSGNISLAAA